MKHCDEYINDPDAPMPLRWFLWFQRLPAVDKMLCMENGVKEPELYADWKTYRVKVTMASRFGDVGIKSDFKGTGYSRRVSVEELSNFSHTP